MNKFMKKLMTKKEGFTLVELIVVIAILAILAGVAIPAYSGYITKANKTADMTALSAVKTAAMAATATESTVTAMAVTEVTNGSNTIDITCEDGRVFKLVYSTNKWADAVTSGEGANVVGEADVIADFNTFMKNANFDLKSGTSASWSSGDWTISE